ncbi:MAG: DUF2281 domain-containing protein [Betaproteobacteria bacterium]|nr:DUF2281 domain-containing protein [Betaproteobacteria bacterium]
MGYAELIQTLQTLPQERQAEVFDFVEFLAERYSGKKVRTDEHATGALADFRAHPFKVKSFVPLTRDEANAR